MDQLQSCWGKLIPSYKLNIEIYDMHRLHFTIHLVPLSKPETFIDVLTLTETSVAGNPKVGFGVHKHFQASYPFAYFSEGASINIIKNRSSYLHPIPCYFPS